MEWTGDKAWHKRHQELLKRARHMKAQPVVDRDELVELVVTDIELAGRRQQKSMRQALDGAVNVAIVPHRDVRGRFVRTQDPALVQIGDLLAPPLLALEAAEMAEAS
jgi:hypothetical protein